MNVADTIVFLLLGVIFMLSGITGILRGGLQTGLGGGRTAGAPLLKADVNGASAVVVSISLVAGGILIAFPSIHQMLATTDISDDWFWLRFLGILVIFGGVVFGFVLSAAITLGENIGKKIEHRDDG